MYQENGIGRVNPIMALTYGAVMLGGTQSSATASPAKRWSSMQCSPKHGKVLSSSVMWP